MRRGAALAGRIAALFLAAAFVRASTSREIPLVVACAGDSLMRPVPGHLRDLAPAAGLALDIREWAQGGLSSETYPAFFRRNLPRWKGTRCDAILLQLGTNDAVPLLEERYRPEAFDSGIAAILAGLGSFEGRAAARPVLLLATVPLFCDRPESAAKNRMVDGVINPALRAAAARTGAVLVDNCAVLKGRPDLYDSDCVHPNGEGEKALARSWLDALRRIFGRSPPFPRAPNGALP